MWTYFIQHRKMVMAWLLLNIADMGLTLAATGAGAAELFPLARLLIGWQMAAFMLFKILAPLIVLPVLYITGYFRIIRALNTAMWVVVIWNALVFILVL